MLCEADRFRRAAEGLAEAGILRSDLSTIFRGAGVIGRNAEEGNGDDS